MKFDHFPHNFWIFDSFCFWNEYFVLFFYILLLISERQLQWNVYFWLMYSTIKQYVSANVPRSGEKVEHKKNS